jgi:hypothetical protein
MWFSIASVAALACSGETGSDGEERQAGDPAEDAGRGPAVEPAANVRTASGRPAKDLELRDHLDAAVEMTLTKRYPVPPPWP